MGRKNPLGFMIKKTQKPTTAKKHTSEREELDECLDLWRISRL